MTQNLHRKYALAGFIWSSSIHILFYLGNVAIVGLHIEHLVTLVTRALPVSALVALIFFLVSFLKYRILRICAVIILLPLTFPIVLYWSW